MYIKEEEIYPPNISKISLNFEKQIMFLMIPNEEKEGWYYLVAKKLSALLKGKHQNIMVTFITWINFILLKEKINLISWKSIYK